MIPIKAILFDVYGTLLDPASIATTASEMMADAGEFVALWRAKQLEYSWLMSLMGRYESFWEITDRALSYTCERFMVMLNEGQREDLLDSWYTVSPYPGVVEGLNLLTERGFRLGALSNGNPEMLEKGLKSAGIVEKLEAVLSVEEVGIFKPSPEVYKLGLRWLESEDPAEIGFVSSNSWDAIGAAGFGFRVCWVNRTEFPLDKIGPIPAAQVSNFGEVVEFFA